MPFLLKNNCIFCNLSVTQLAYTRKSEFNLGENSYNEAEIQFSPFTAGSLTGRGAAGLRGNRQPGQQYYDREEDPGSLQ
ncbi:hypothetical protein ACXO1J_02520 [Lactobacillus delbrueckii subsp. bulgaricus]